MVIRRLLIAVSIGLIVMTAGKATPARAGITINESGYTDVPVGTLGNGASPAFGAVAGGSGGTVYATGASTGHGLYRITGGVSTALADFPNYALSLQVAGNTAYVGLEGGNIYSVNLTGPSATLLGSSGVGTAESMAIAPVGFGTFGGDLIVSGFGGIVAFNPNTFASTTFLSASNIYSGVAFTNDGRLLVADYNNNRILAVTAGGISSVFATVSSPGAIAVNPNTGDVYVAAENTGTIEHFLSNGTYVDALASNVIWDYGYYPSDLAFTADGTGLIYGQVGISDPSAGIREITGFQGPNVSTPEPSTLISATLAGLFAIGYACYRRTAQIA